MVDLHVGRVGSRSAVYPSGVRRTLPLAAVLCVACGLDQSAISWGERDAAAVDAPIGIDAPPTDAPMDPDTGPRDGGPDTGPRDGGTDAGPEDAGTDAPIDVGTDVGTDAFVPECDPADVQCDDSDTGLEVCVDGRWAPGNRCVVGCDVDHCLSYDPANVDLAFRPTSGASSSVDGESWDTTDCAAIPHDSAVHPQTVGGPDVCVVRFDALSIGNLTVTGARPLIVLVDSDARVTGRIDLTAMNIPAAVARNGEEGENVDSYADGGGGGGAHCGHGGDGGHGSSDGGGWDRAEGGAGGSRVGGGFLLTPLTPGGRGAAGGGPSGPGGRGGGALQISVLGELTMAGTIDAFGQGGGRGIDRDNWSAGGGGGAGGGVLLEAGGAVLAAAGTVHAGGGGGGSPAACDMNGRVGGAGNVIDGRAAGGAAITARCLGGNQYSGDGGDGGWTDARDGTDGEDNGTDGANGAGGGGGAGCLIIRATRHEEPNHNAYFDTDSITLE